MTEDRVWVFQMLTRNALRWGRVFVVFVMGMLVVLVIAGSQCACSGSHASSPATIDAASPVYHECVTDAGTFEVTCGSDGAVFCSREGGITCDLPDAGPTACCRR